jgi:hypothetical protein
VDSAPYLQQVSTSARVLGGKIQNDGHGNALVPVQNLAALLRDLEHACDVLAKELPKIAAAAGA